MRNLVVSEFLSLDGVLQAPGGEVGTGQQRFQLTHHRQHHPDVAATVADKQHLGRTAHAKAFRCHSASAVSARSSRVKLPRPSR